jgi:hypothetical protein
MFALDQLFARDSNKNNDGLQGFARSDADLQAQDVEVAEC